MQINFMYRYGMGFCLNPTSLVNEKRNICFEIVRELFVPTLF